MCLCGLLGPYVGPESLSIGKPLAPILLVVSASRPLRQNTSSALKRAFSANLAAIPRLLSGILLYLFFGFWLLLSYH